MNILVVGGAGYLGSVLIPELQKKHNVRVIDLCWFGNYLPPATLLQKKDALACTIEDFINIDCVICLAGLSNDPMADFNPQLNYLYNAEMPGKIALLAKQAGVKRFILASSCSIYGENHLSLCTETTSPKTTFAYGLSKLQGELACHQHQDHNFSVISLRQGTVCGHSPRMRFDLFLNTMLKTALTQQTIQVSNPEIWRPLLDIRDAIQAYVLAINAPCKLSGIFNIASENTTIGAAALLAKDELMQNGVNNLVIKTLHVADNRNYRVSIVKAEQNLGFSPKHKIRETIDMLYTKYLNYPNFNHKKHYNLETFKNIFTSNTDIKK